MDATQILLVEDDQTIAMGLAFALGQEGYAVTACACMLEARQALDGHAFQLAILDINLPDGDGYALCRELKQSSPETSIIFLTVHEEEMSAVMGLELGADDYITKPFNPLELVARVKSQLRRYTQLGNMNTQTDSRVYKCGGLQINDENKEVFVDGELIKLTPIEYNILLLLVKNAGKVFSIDQIYEEIWNEEAIGADNTVAVHIRHIREKIEINPREPRYLKVVWGVGYKIEKQ